jgi:hypothetical protein
MKKAHGHSSIEGGGNLLLCALLGLAVLLAAHMDAHAQETTYLLHGTPTQGGTLDPDRFPATFDPSTLQCFGPGIVNQNELNQGAISRAGIQIALHVDRGFGGRGRIIVVVDAPLISWMVIDYSVEDGVLYLDPFVRFADRQHPPTNATSAIVTPANSLLGPVEHRIKMEWSGPGVQARSLNESTASVPQTSSTVPPGEEDPYYHGLGFVSFQTVTLRRIDYAFRLGTGYAGTVTGTCQVTSPSGAVMAARVSFAREYNGWFGEAQFANWPEAGQYTAVCFAQVSCQNVMPGVSCHAAERAGVAKGTFTVGSGQ